MATPVLWTKRLGFGACAAVLGSARALTVRELRQVFLRNALQLLAISLVLVAVLWLLILPLEWLASLVVSAKTLDATLRAFRYSAWSTIPFVLVTACRYCNVAMFENAFFAGLAVRDPELAQTIRKKKAIYWDWEYVRHTLWAVARQLAFALVALLAAPLLGAAIPLFRFGHRIRHMDAVFYVPLVLAFCVPATRTSALHVVHLWMDARAVVRELYDPIVARLKSAHSDAAVHQKAAEGSGKSASGKRDDTEVAPESKRNLQSEWHRGRSDAARLGFAVVVGCMLQVPFVGPLTWFVGFVAAGLFAPELIELKWFRYSAPQKAL